MFQRKTVEVLVKTALVLLDIIIATKLTTGVTAFTAKAVGKTLSNQEFHPWAVSSFSYF